MKKLILLLATLAMTGLSACDDGDSKEVECANGAQKCERHSVWSCVDGSWEIQKICQTAESCNETTFVCDAPVVVCEAGAKRCENNAVEVCTDNAWHVLTSCDSNEYCSDINHNCLLSCTDGKTKCTANGKLESCTNNKWVVSDCSSGQVCPSNKNVCELIVCEENMAVCNDDADGILSCINNAWVPRACKGDASICDEGSCVVCINDDKRCENNAVELCDGNVWTTETACGAKTCNEDTYTCDAAACDVGWKRCSGNVVEVCNAAGVYVAATPSACAAGLLCLTGDAHTASCVQCKASADCAGVVGAPICHNNVCVACLAGDKKCHASDGSLLVCAANNTWPSTGAACTAGQTCVAGAAQCTAIIGYCAGNADCKDPLYPNCDKNKCVCAVGQSDCKTEAGVAKHALCADSKWTAYTACNVATPVCNAAKTACAECAKDSDCIDGNKCNIATGLCKADPACAASEIVCDGKTARTCTVDKWVGQNCPNQCLAGTGCVTCFNNSHCTTTENPICNTTLDKCVACVPDAAKCINNKLSTCSAEGVWGASIACDAGFECVDGQSACTAISCAPDSRRCVGSIHQACNPAGNGYSDIIDCVTETTTPNCIASAAQCVECTQNSHCVSNICKADNTCAPVPVCVEGASKCEGNSFMTCVSNAWTNQLCSDATPACEATAGCVECTQDSHCLAAKPVCNTTSHLCEIASEDVWNTEDLEKCTWSSGYGVVTCPSGLAFSNAYKEDLTLSIEGQSARMGKNAQTATITVAKGVGKISLDVKLGNAKAADTISISVNGNEIVSKTGMTAGSVEKLLNNAVNVAGSAVIVINSSDRFIVDNLKWTNHP